MCGIAGIFNLVANRPPDLGALTRMAAAQRHRGPDGWGVYRDDRCGLAHNRLSIIDLEGGAQPLSNEDGTLWISFNGEIFNYPELREELLGKGHRFRTKSDTEVVVHAYEEWKERCFERFNGQWALALWDTLERRLTLSRDRLGVRPLHLVEREGRLYFASEVKALFAADPALTRAFDPAGLAQSFTFWSPVAPRTPFENVKEVAAGMVESYREGAPARIRRYWEPSYPMDRERVGVFAGTLEEAAEAVGEALADATRLRMVRADVPVGCYLSGGLDSSLVSALARVSTGQNFRTFSLRFEDAEYDESPFQRRMVEWLGTAHDEVVVTRKDICAAFPEVVFHAERPLLRAAPAPLSLLSRLVREKGTKVVLAGEGADEMFAGYDLFREAKVRRFWARQEGSRMRPTLLARLYPYLARSPVAQRAIAEKFFGRDLDRAGEPGFGHGIRWDSAAALQRLFSTEMRRQAEAVDVRSEFLSTLPADFSRWTSLSQDQYLETRVLLGGYLLSSQGDRMLMAHSVEGRFPFLDHRVVTLANSLPASYKLRVLDEKHVLKKSAERLVPAEIRFRKKQPYRAPDAASFVGSETGWADELLATASIREAGVFDPVVVDRLWRRCQGRGAMAPFSNQDNMAVVGVLSTQLLWDRLLRRPAVPQPMPRGLLIDRVGRSGDAP